MKASFGSLSGSRRRSADIPLEQQLFTWEKWDYSDDETLQYRGVVLTRDICELPAGSRFDQATILMDKSVLELRSLDVESGKGVCHVFDLKLDAVARNA